MRTAIPILGSCPIENEVTEKALSLSIPLNESRNQVNTKNKLKKKLSAVIFTEDKSTAASVIFDGSLFFT